MTHRKTRKCRCRIEVDIYGGQSLGGIFPSVLYEDLAVLPPGLTQDLRFETIRLQTNFNNSASKHCGLIFIGSQDIYFN